MRSSKGSFSSRLTMLILLGMAPIVSLHAADTNESNEAVMPEDAKAVASGLEQTLEYNFSPADRARLRKALVDYARNNDPEYIQIKQRRKAMKQSLKARFMQCNRDLDDVLNRQEVTECLPQVARHFGNVDVDEDNVITFEELELAQAKRTERYKKAEAKLEAQRIKAAEAEIKNNAAKPKKSKQAATKGRHPS